VAAPQRRRLARRRRRANSDAERRALAKASGRRSGPPRVDADRRVTRAQ
jgi:hypothetical protein